MIEQVKNKVENGIRSMPSLSPAVTQIIDLANDINATPRDLTEIIKTDPALTTKILNLVNSSYFSMPNKVASVTRAIVLLGFNTIKNIALSAEFVKLKDSNPRNKKFNYTELWKHMLSVGVVAKSIARETGQPRENIEEYFITGLIHDLGHFMLMHHATNEFYKIIQYANSKALSVEKCTREVFGFSGQDLTVKILNHWKLQEQLCDAISDTKGEQSHLGKVLSISDKFCRANEYGYVINQNQTEISENEYASVDLEQSFLENNKSDLEDKIHQAQIFIS